MALASLVLFDIGYTLGRCGVVLDAPWVYWALGLVAAAALAFRMWEIWSVGLLTLPQRSPGLAAAAVGVGLVLYGAVRGFVARRPVLRGPGSRGRPLSIHPPITATSSPATIRLRRRPAR